MITGKEVTIVIRLASVLFAQLQIKISVPTLHFSQRMLAVKVLADGR